MAALVVSLQLLLPPQGLLDSLLYEGRFPEVIAAADSLLEQFPGDTQVQILAYRYRAFALVALGDTALARESFLRLLRLRPCLELDPFATSPPVWRVFHRAREEIPCPGASPVAPSVLDSLRGRLAGIEQRFQALRRSLILPGSGQRLVGERAKGDWLTRLWLVSLGGWALSHWAYGRAREAYLRATDPLRAREAYRTANRWYRARLFFAAASVGLYLYGVLDLF